MHGFLRGFLRGFLSGLSDVCHRAPGGKKSTHSMSLFSPIHVARWRISQTFNDGGSACCQLGDLLQHLQCTGIAEDDSHIHCHWQRLTEYCMVTRGLVAIEA